MNWPERTLGDVCEINPRLPRDHGLADDTSVSFVPMAAVDEVSGVVRDKQQRPFLQVKKGYTSFRDGDVLFAKITPCMENGKAAVASDLLNGVGFGSTEFHVLRPKAGVLAEWIYYFVRREPFRREAKRNFTGTAGQQRVPTTFLAKCRIHVPPLDEQRRIIDLLSRAEGIVRLRREAQKKAAEIIPALFLDNFGDPATNPKGWPKHQLDQVCGISYGLADKLDTSITADGGVRILTISNVLLNGTIDYTVERYCVPTIEQRKKAEVRRGDLLFNWRNGSETHIGKTAMWGCDESVLHVSFLLRLRPDQSKVTPHFLWAMMNRLRESGYFVSVARQQINRKFNASELSALEVPIPPVHMQTRFRTFVEQFRATEAQLEDANVKADATFSALLGRAFSVGGKQAAAKITERTAVA